MRSTQQRLIQYGGAILLVSLLLAPIVASGHAHAAHPSAQPCATCVAIYHTPVIGSPPVVAVTAAPVVVGVERVVAPQPMVPPYRSATNRAPPSFLLVQST
jgi:hypothetical protein